MSDRPDIDKLQEQMMFTDRAVEQLSDEMVAMTRRMNELAGKMGRLEGRLERLLDGIQQLENGSSGDPADERPPHWGPPPADK